MNIAPYTYRVVCFIVYKEIFVVKINLIIRHWETEYIINFNFNFILPKVNTDYIRQAQVLNIDNLIKIILLMKCLMKT